MVHKLLVLLIVLTLANHLVEQLNSFFAILEDFLYKFLISVFEVGVGKELVNAAQLMLLQIVDVAPDCFQWGAGLEIPPELLFD